MFLFCCQSKKCLHFTFFKIPHVSLCYSLYFKCVYVGNFCSLLLTLFPLLTPGPSMCSDMVRLCGRFLWERSLVKYGQNALWSMGSSPASFPPCRALSESAKQSPLAWCWQQRRKQTVLSSLKTKANLTLINTVINRSSNSIWVKRLIRHKCLVIRCSGFAGWTNVARQLTAHVTWGQQTAS